VKPTIFIDGQEGTTGLKIKAQLRGRTDIEQLTIPVAERKNIEARQERLNSANIVFLCLPDQAAKEAVSLIKNPQTKVIDASTAHRTAPGWTYGFPELTKERRDEIRYSMRVANPGCHATGFLAIVTPLMKAGKLQHDEFLTCHSLTGYSGGGKTMINEYERSGRANSLDAPRIYGLGFAHKHIPEMLSQTGLTVKPHFTPIVANYYNGMAVSVMLHQKQTGLDSAQIHELLTTYYTGEHFIKVSPFNSSDQLAIPGFIEANAHIGTNVLELLVFGDGEQTLVTARFDNLGKGASGAAIQNMNLMLGLDEKAGL